MNDYNSVMRLQEFASQKAETAQTETYTGRHAIIQDTYDTYTCSILLFISQ